MALNNLYPPIIDTYMPAFAIEEDKESGNYTGTCRIYFALSPYSSETIKEVWVSVTDQNTNLPLLQSNTGLIKYSFAEGPGLSVAEDQTRLGNDKYYIDISSDQLRTKTWAVDRIYKVQLRLASDIINNTMPEINANQNKMSEWSKVCLICPIIEPTLSLIGFVQEQTENISPFNNVISGKMIFKDKETLESYRIKIYSLKAEEQLEYDSGIIYTDSFAPNEIYHQLPYSLIDGSRYRMDFEYTTKSNYHKIVKFPFVVMDIAGERIDATITATANDNLGRIEVKVFSDTERYFGNLIIRRASHKTNFSHWEDVKVITLDSAKYLDFTWNDYTAESGVWYKYCIQKCSFSGARGLVVTTDAPAMLNLEDIFISGGGRTLKIKFNPQINSFTHTLLESSTQTIGGKYPFIKRNGNLGYKQFSISGLISHLMDEGELFTNQSELYNNQNELYDTYNFNNGINDYNNLIIEKEFRDKVYKFLHDGQVKLFRSATEGSFLIRLMNISLSPENTLGRMLYTFNATAYEIDDLMVQNINKYNIQPIGDLKQITVGTYEGYGQIQLEGTSATLAGLLKENEDIKNQNSSLVSIIQYIDKVKIQMDSEPEMFYFNGTKYEFVKEIPDFNKTKEKEKLKDGCFYSYGYVIKVSFEGEVEEYIYINPHGYLELNGEGLKIKNISLLGDNGTSRHNRCLATIDYHFIATQTEDAKMSPSHLAFTSKISQIYGRYSPTEELGDFIYQKHAYNYNYQHENLIFNGYNRLYSLNAIEIETEPNTVLYVIDSSKEGAKRFVIGETGFLRIEENDFIIKNFSLLGKNLREKEKDALGDYVDRITHSYEWLNNSGIVHESVNAIETPIENGLYKVASLTDVWLPENINSPAAGNDYLEQLRNWTDPIYYGGEFFHYVIYHQGQWYLCTETYKDIVKPVSAIITYYFEVEEGTY